MLFSGTQRRGAMLGEKLLDRNSVEIVPCHWSAHLEEDEVVMEWIRDGQEKDAAEPR